ncbi:hypothetical protein JCM10212_004949 [Sporobolomyces blumeae]
MPSAASPDGSLPDDDPAEQLYRTAQHYIGQVVDLLERTVTTDSQLRHQSKLSAGSTLGKHLRHLHDHYRLLLDALPTAAPEAGSSDIAPDRVLNVNYDVRLRNGDAESRHDAAVASFKHLSERLRTETKAGKGVPASQRVRLTAVTPEKVVVESTFGRELWFASFHAVHHFALIRVIAVSELGLEVPDDFGVAPATLVHRHELTPNKL